MLLYRHRQNRATFFGYVIIALMARLSRIITLPIMILHFHSRFLLTRETFFGYVTIALRMRLSRIITIPMIIVHFPFFRSSNISARGQFTGIITYPINILVIHVDFSDTPLSHLRTSTHQRINTSTKPQKRLKIKELRC